MSNYYSVPSNAFDPPYLYRFYLVPKSSSFDQSYVVQVSCKIKSIRKAFYIACETYLDFLNENKLKVSHLAIFLEIIFTPDLPPSVPPPSGPSLYKVYKNFNSSDKSDYDYFHLTD